MVLRSGRIRYTNDLPVYAAFDAGAIPYPGELHADVPTNLNRMLLAGELDLSPISAFAYAHDAERLVLLPDLCIGARSEVVSVVLVSRTPLALLGKATVYVSNESATGANLLRVVLERRYGVTPKYVTTGDAPRHAREGRPALLIGDSAIDALLDLPGEQVYDLGTLWHDWKSAQTVFAVWAARREVFESNPQGVRECMHALTDAYTWSRAHMNEVVGLAQRMKARPDGFYEDYYGKLNFMFHSAAQHGLATFFRELVAISAIARLPQSSPEVLGVAS
ncbi:MAG: hypothetical protein DLM50_01740 [Candidatus Meridianibacter frigidus]|nr:MAG: hypothetical protein DLM50_01740 [Candidatus Eremiobacteraeota bacterium]